LALLLCDSVKVSGVCPENFNFLTSITSYLEVSEFELIISTPSANCNISSIIATQATLTKARVVLNNSINTLLNLEILAQLPQLNSFILNTDESVSPKCPVKLPASFSANIRYIDLHACQLTKDSPKFVIHNNIKLGHSIEIITDRTRQDWVVFTDTSEPAMNKISTKISENHSKQVFYYPDDRQELLDRVNDISQTVEIYYVGNPQNANGNSIDQILSASKSDVQEIYDIFFTRKTIFSSSKPKYPNIQSITFFAFNYLELSKSSKFRLFRFADIPSFSETRENLKFFRLNSLLYVYNDLLVYRGPCESFPGNFSKALSISSVRLGITSECRSSGSIIDPLNGEFRSWTISNDISLSNFANVETIDFSFTRNFNRIISLVGTEKLKKLKKVIFPEFRYSMIYPIYLSGDPERAIEIISASSPNSVKIAGNTSTTTFKQISFLGPNDFSVLSLPVSYLIVEDLVLFKSIDTENWINEKTIRFTCKQDTSTLFFEAIQKMTNLEYGGDFVTNRRVTEIPRSFVSHKMAIHQNRAKRRSDGS
jgi:hypothetical protein